MRYGELEGKNICWASFSALRKRARFVQGTRESFLGLGRRMDRSRATCTCWYSSRSSHRIPRARLRGGSPTGPAVRCCPAMPMPSTGKGKPPARSAVLPGDPSPTAEVMLSLWGGRTGRVSPVSPGTASGLGAGPSMSMVSSTSANCMSRCFLESLPRRSRSFSLAPSPPSSRTSTARSSTCTLSQCSSHITSNCSISARARCAISVSFLRSPSGHARKSLCSVSRSASVQSPSDAIRFFFSSTSCSSSRSSSFARSSTERAEAPPPNKASNLDA
mmetsp:Transcript_606/g.1612  ORF Transcript_606/g.1612 Transcript_606/m.1612 type:complete len:275 (-) Transcript_606:243-1067(-)